MAKFKVNGTILVDICVEVEADTFKKAIEKAENTCILETYANNVFGISNCEYEINVHDFGRIDWYEDYLEMESE